MRKKIRGRGKRKEDTLESSSHSTYRFSYDFFFFNNNERFSATRKTGEGMRLLCPRTSPLSTCSDRCVYRSKGGNVSVIHALCMYAME